MVREEYFSETPTQLTDVFINVSSADVLTDDRETSLLLQIAKRGNEFTCAYLNDKSAQQLVKSLLDYLELPNPSKPQVTYSVQYRYKRTKPDADKIWYSFGNWGNRKEALDWLDNRCDPAEDYEYRVAKIVATEV